MDNDNDTLGRIASALERIASVVEQRPAKTDPMAVDANRTHRLATEFKERSGQQ